MLMLCLYLRHIQHISLPYHTTPLNNHTIGRIISTIPPINKTTFSKELCHGFHVNAIPRNKLIHPITKINNILPAYPFFTIPQLFKLFFGIICNTKFVAILKSKIVIYHIYFTIRFQLFIYLHNLTFKFHIL